MNYLRQLFALLSFCTVTSSVVKGQTLTFSPGIKQKMYLQMLAFDNEAIWTYQSAIDGSHKNDGFAKYNHDLLPGEFLAFDNLDKGTLWFLNAFIYKGRFTYVYETLKKKYYRLNIAQPLEHVIIENIDSSAYPGFLGGSKGDLMSSPFAGTRYMSESFYSQISSDQKNIFLYYNMHFANDGYKQQIYGLNNYLQPVEPNISLLAAGLKSERPQSKQDNSKKSDMARTSPLITQNFMVLRSDVIASYSGGLYNCITRFTFKRFAYSIFDVHTHNSSELVIPPIEGTIYYEPTSTTSGDTLKLSGLYAREKSKARDGYYCYVIDLKTAKLIQSIITPINPEGNIAFEKAMDAKGNRIDFSPLLPMQNGNNICIIEKYSDNTSDCEKKYHNLYVACFDINGNFLWAQEIIRKNGWVPPTGLGSFGLLTNPDQVHLYFNADDIVWDYTISQDGKIKSSNLNNQIPANEKGKFEIFTTSSLKLSQNEIIFPCLKNKQTCLVKISY